MKLGLIGNPLDHSWSPEIHRYLAGADYELWPLAEDELDMFFSEKDFDGINVTIPYKSSVLKYLDDIDDTALSVGATNTVINRGGMLMYGKEASNRKQEIDRQHYTIPNQRPKDKHCGKI